jgi:prepilin-type N-terminal cleavage/methylation domain-containing protein
MNRGEARPKTARPGVNGFTLVEVLVSVLILAGAIVGLIGAFPVGYQDVVYGGRVSQAVALAQQELEALKQGPFPPTSGTQTSGAYTLTWTVTSVGVGGAADDLRKVSLVVTWPQMTRPGRYDLAGFLSKPY